MDCQKALWDENIKICAFCGEVIIAYYRNILQLLQAFTIELLYYIYIFAYITERSRKFVWHVD